MRSVSALITLKLLLVSAGMATAEPVFFDGRWREQGFLRLFSNDYIQRGTELDVFSNGTVSLLWRPLEKSQWQSTQASWSWAVAEGVGATDLSRKGGDDRNLALYFVFTDADAANDLSPRSARRLLRHRETRALVYVWGGDAPRRTMLKSPYHTGLRTVISREAGVGRFDETVDLAADYQSAFGSKSQVLVGIGVTADSDDTNGRIRARISNLFLN